MNRAMGLAGSVAQRLSLPEAQVLAVATFYTMYNKRPVGTFHAQVCVSISCAIMGAHHLMHYLEKRLGVRVGETSKDGRFTLSEVECLASCGTAPMMQVNDDYHENLATEAEIDRVIGPLLTNTTQRAE
jgi:NADH-quinone oxidoreductase subunit E